jgi:hypothetical protein
MPNHPPKTALPKTIEFWEDLKQLTASVVQEMNRAADLHGKTGGLECRFADGETIVVSKNSCPQMYVAVCFLPDAIDVNTRLVLGGPDETEREFRESLTINIDDSGASLRSANGDVFTVDQAVYHILQPFLHIGTVRC